MKKIPVEESVGQTLCHDMTAIMESGEKCARFRRGHVIEREDIPVLLNMGKSHVFIWEPDADEVHEEDAARAVTEAVCGENVGFSGPSEGKFQIYSKINGMFSVNSEALKAINTVEDYTIACRPKNIVVQESEKLAGVRIVPLVTKRQNVEQAVQIAKDNAPVFSVKPFLPLKTGIIITGGEIYYGRIKDKFEPVMREKLSKYGARIIGAIKCPDDLTLLSQAIKDFLSQGAELILLTGGMSVDPDDLTPTAIKKSGARLVTQGVPMQPGNMLTIAYLDKTVLIGVPGASLHQKVTSLDVFLPRVFTDETIGREEIAGLGEGGFCMSCDVCRYPTCYFGNNS